MELTVSKLLEMQKSLKERRQQLTDLLKETSCETSWRDSSQKSKTPQYDTVKVDEKLVRINNALFEIASTIKQANAVTKVTIELDYPDLISPIAR